MTLTKTMKTKLVLGILAAAASLSLAVGGTLMFFTADSGPATNTVTLGNAEIQLQEKGGAGTDDDTGDEYAIVGEDGFDGIDFGNTVVPGDTLDKQPRVVNTGSVPVYVYVKGTVKVNDEAVAVDGSWSAADLQQVGDILAGVTEGTLGENWIYIDDDANPADGYFVYATGTAAEYELAELAALGEEGDTTDNIFTTVTIPTDVDNTLAGYKISIDLAAYAVQSENNTAETIEDLTAQFAE